MGDLIPVIREDITQALAESGGQFTSKALDSMERFDSFLKETLRMTPLAMCACPGRHRKLWLPKR